MALDVTPETLRSRSEEPRLKGLQRLSVNWTERRRSETRPSRQQKPRLRW